MRHRAYPDNDYSWIEELYATWHGEYSITVSVVLTTFNMKSLVEKTFCGLILQTYPHELFEVIVSDDGSSDGIEELTSKYERFFSRFSIIIQEDKGYRLATARNNGVLESRNEVIISLDGDVLPVPELLEAHLRWFHLTENLATVGYLRYVDTNSISPAEVLTKFESVRVLPDYGSISNWGNMSDRRLPEFVDFKHHPAAYNCFHGGNVGFRRRQAMDIGLFSEDFNGNWGYEDLEFGYRLWKSGVFLIPVPFALGLHQERVFLTTEERRRQRNINFEKMSRKVPGFKEYREQIGR